MAVHRVLLPGVIVCAAVVASAQTAGPTFEVASIRPNLSGPFSSGIGWRPGGTFTATNVPLVRLVQFAYDIPESLILGGPDWIRNNRFDINAKAAAEVPHDHFRLMMKSLLEDRFKLRLRTEEREMPVFELVLARTDGRVGPNLHDCSNKNDQAGLSSPEKPFVAPRGGTVAAGDCSNLAPLVNLASAKVQTAVINKTGLSGQWRYDIYFGPDLPQPDALNPDLPSFVTALREQLGLKLERTRGVVDVLVVESADQPTEN